MGRILATIGSAALLALAAAPATADTACANGPLTQWSIAAGGNGHFYQVVCAPAPVANPPAGTIGGISWTDANTAATLAGGHLATPATAAENAFVAGLITSPAYWYVNPFNAYIGPWIGLSRSLPCGSGPWTWVTGEPFGFSNWAGGEPSCSGSVEHIVSYYTCCSGAVVGSTWNDLSDPVGLNAYVVEFDAPPGCATPPSGLVSWWPGDGSGIDLRGGNNGTAQNGLSYAPGLVGQAFNSNYPTGDYLLIGSPAGLQLQDFTVAGWIQLPSIAALQAAIPSTGVALVGFGSGGYGFGLATNMTSGTGGLNPIGFGELFLTKVGSNAVSSQGFAIADTNFHHIAVTKSGGNVVFYIDGIAHPVPIQYDPGFSFSGPIGIAGVPGLNDEIQIYNRALTGAEVQSIFIAGGAGHCKPGCLDIDGNGTVDALTDGLMLLRALFGLTGTAVTHAAIGPAASRSTWGEIQPWLNARCGTSFLP